MLNDATEKVKEKSCYALESFCENLGEDIVPFLQPLLERLTHMLQTSRHETQQMAISALASVALAAGSQFTPYYETVFGFMRVLLQQTGEQELLLRARALECVGLMNLAVGRTVCEPVLHECTASALAGLALELPELREYTYGFFGQLAELIGSRPLYAALVTLCASFYAQTGQATMGAVRIDLFMALHEIDDPHRPAASWDATHTFIMCIDAALRELARGGAAAARPAGRRPEDRDQYHAHGGRTGYRAGPRPRVRPRDLRAAACHVSGRGCSGGAGGDPVEL